MIYLDNAASSYPKPASVSKAVCEWINRNGANAGRSGHEMSIEASRLVFETRTLISEMFGVEDVENIAFVPNATYGLNILIQGLLTKGDHAVTTDLEHNSVLRPLNMLSLKGVSHTVASTDLYSDDKTVDNIINSIKSNTKLVICTQCSNVCGKVMPIKKIADNLPKGVRIVVDGSQGAGIIPTNLKELGVDYYCAPSHKGLLAPQGCGFVAVRSEAPSAILSGGTGSDSFNLNQPSYMPDVLECGTLPTPIIAGMYESLKFIESVGAYNIYSHKCDITKFLYNSICEMDHVDTYLDVNRCLAVGLVPFNIKGFKSEEVGERLSLRGICVRSGFHCAPLFHKKMGTEDIGMVRVSFGYFNTKNQVKQLIKELNNYKKL